MSPRRLPGPLDRLDGRARRRIRRVVDALGAPLGSWREGRDPSVVAVTFDDGPDPVVTPALLDVLDARAVRSTFFLLVDQAERHPELARTIAARGHEIALHGLDHRPLPALGGRRAHAYLLDARRRLEAIVGVPVRWYRPPYGKQTPATWFAARRAGLDVVVWSADAADWLDDAPDVVTRRAIDGLEPGGILLLHERVERGPGGEPVHTAFDRPALVEAVLASAAARGLTPVTVGELVGRGARRSLWWRR